MRVATLVAECLHFLTAYHRIMSELVPSYEASTSATHTLRRFTTTQDGSLLQPPCYTVEPTSNEQRLQYTARVNQNGIALPTGTFRHSCKAMAITAMHQEENASTPSFDRLSTVEGSITISNPHQVVNVSVKLEGSLKITLRGSASGFKQIWVAQERVTLWDLSGSSESCPASLWYSIEFPAHFLHNGAMHPTPPSHRLEFVELDGGIISKAKYRLVVTVCRRHAVMPKSTSTANILLHYRPRSRPSLPILPDDSLFNSIKPCPEDWFQTIGTLLPRPGSRIQVAPVDVSLFIPSVRVYSLEDKIPFHIQICGPMRSPLELFPHKEAEGQIRMTLERRLTINVNNRPGWTSRVIGVGSINCQPLPSCDDVRSSSDLMHLDWAGELQCRSDHAKVPSFSASIVHLRDFITLSIYPRTSGLLPLTMMIPIRLVTDSWSTSYASEDHLGLI